jgi:hypothetical protein
MKIRNWLCVVLVVAGVLAVETPIAAFCQSTTPPTLANNVSAQAAVTVVDYILSLAVEFTECVAVDGNNSQKYKQSFDGFLTEYAQKLNDIENILHKEAVMSGVEAKTIPHNIEYLKKRAGEKLNENFETDPIGFLKICHALPQSLAMHVGPFRPLASIFPAQMKIIDQWKP